MNIFLKSIQENNILLLKIAFVLSFFLFAFSAHAATLSLSPATGVYTAGQAFTARVVVNTSGASINAADGTLSFNPNELSVVSVSKGSIFNLWTSEPAFSNSAGSISFSGGTPSGYKGGSGTVISVTFRAKSAGKPKVSFVKGSVLAADGLGTNVLTTMGSASFTIAAAGVTPEPETIEYIAPANTPAAPKVTSNTHPDAGGWYTSDTAELSWSVPSGVTAVRTLLDENSGTIPTKVYDTPLSKITLDDLEQGVQYFHIQFKNSDGWGRVTHYRLAVDSKNPTDFSIALAEDADLSNPVQTLLLETEDGTSKVQRFNIQIDGAEPYEYRDEAGSSTVTLSPLEPGHHTVVIEAFDQAGNSIVDSFSFSILSFDKPLFTEYPSQINEEVIPVIQGITRPNAKVGITLARIGVSASSDDAVRTYEIRSAEDGVFTFIPDGRLSLGVYELTAVAVDQYGAQSEVSDVIKIAVQQPGYLRVGSLVLSILSIVVPLVALCVLLFVGIWYFIFRIRRLRSSVEKEAGEAMSMLSSEFGKLQKALETQKGILEKSRKTKKLTKAEQQVIESISAALTASRKRVEKEIGDVEDIVD